MGYSVETSITPQDDPGRLADSAECVDSGWLVELDVDDDAAVVRQELEGLEDFPERKPTA